MFVELPISGIHRLFTAASSRSSHSSRAPLESVAEESHTYDLLYPDPNELHQTHDHAYPLKYSNDSSAASAAASFDDRGGLDIQSPRDVRILIAQDGNAISQQPKVLYDSNPPPPLPPSRLGSPTDSRQDIQSPTPGRVTERSLTSPPQSPKSKHGRYFSLGQKSALQIKREQSSVNPEPSVKGAFGTTRPRRSATRPATSEGESAQSRLSIERREETEAMLGCMFGSTGLPLVSGTKLHIRPHGSWGRTAQGDASATSSEVGGSRTNTRRRTPLTRSLTAEDLYLSASAPTDFVEQQTPQRSASVLITRVFTVDTTDARVSKAGSVSEISSRHSNESSHDGSVQRKPSSVFESAKAKQTKAPAFSVALVLQLPHETQYAGVNSQRSSSPFMSQSTGFLQRAGEPSWQDSRLTEGYASLADRDIERVMVHWNVLARAMASLEDVAKRLIRDLLLGVETRQPGPTIPALSSNVSRRAEEEESKSKKPIVASQRTLQLAAGALQRSDEIDRAAAATGKRIALNLRIRRVITGQERWGIWREEARWLGKWAGNREQNFFFFNILTAFLGSHIDWLKSMTPAHKKRSGFKRISKKFSAQTPRNSRTVVVATDKMAARRLVFLLAAFLPNTDFPLFQDGMHRSLSWSTSAYSQSPPSGIPILREQSLRRTINRRQRGSRSGPSNDGPHTRHLSFAVPQSTAVDEDGKPSNVATHYHSRRISDTTSVKSPTLPISTSDKTSRKSSTTTSSTVMPEATWPVAHFSNASRDVVVMGTSPVPRPGSSGSLASLNLKNALTRSESQDHSRWGSIVSGFWSNRRGSSTDDSEFLPSSNEGLGITGMPKNAKQLSSTGKLVRMVEEAELVSRRGLHGNGNAAHPTPPGADTVNDLSADESAILSPVEPTPAKNIPERAKAEHFPVKLSIDESDGVIDVDLPIVHSFSSSFASSTSSPNASHPPTASSSFNDRASPNLRSPSKDRSHAGSSEPSVNVAGWLREYHQDFALQAVRPYDNLKEDVKQSMKADAHLHDLLAPSQATDHHHQGRWIETSATLMADTTTFSITKLSMQQRIADPASESSKVEERLIEIPVMDLDATLTDAVERVLGSGCSTRAHSTNASRAPSPSRTLRPEHRGVGIDQTQQEAQTHLEPRSECRRLMLGALEQVARSVEKEVAQTGPVDVGARKIVVGDVQADAEEEEEVVEKDSSLREGVRRWLTGEG
ncbi:MAG: hypothetical protein Q9190_002427 [Brigantiaea leucoxantha]